MGLMLRFALSIGLVICATAGLAAASVPAVQVERDVTPSFFGVHFHRLRLMPNEKAVPTRWPPLRFGYLRLWDSHTRWADLEPEPGQWQFERLDHYVAEAERRGVKVLLTLGSTPRWASQRPQEPCSYWPSGCAAPPSAMADWANYVRVLANRYRGRICCYELWNEPDFSGPPASAGRPVGFFSGGVDDMVEMTRVAHEVLREADPEAKLFGPGFVNGVGNRLAPYLRAGAGVYLDGIAYHFYAWYDEARLLKEIDEVRALMVREGLSHLPLWSTEAGVEVFAQAEALPPGAYRRVSRSEAAAMLARQIVLAAAAGIDAYFYYAWDNDRSGMVDRAGRPLPAYDAMLLVQRWLIGTRLLGCELTRARATVCRGVQDDSPIAIVWNAHDDGVTTVPVPAGQRVVSRQYAVPGWPVAGNDGAPPADVFHAAPNPAFYVLEEIPLQ